MNRGDIPVGRENAITKGDLSSLWQCDEREARGQIAMFRTSASDDAYAILSSSSTPPGYWRSNKPHEIKEFIRETENRAKNTFRMLKDARRILKSIAG
jgi:hypothetical protein